MSGGISGKFISVSGDISASDKASQSVLVSTRIRTASYTINYDGFGNTSSILCGTNTLASYTYASGNGKLISMTYGNGAVESYTYDELERHEDPCRDI